MTPADLDAAEKLAAEASCRLITETNSGPGKGTPCGKVVVEKLHGVRMCADHSAHARRANCMDPLHIDDTVSSRLAKFPALVAECRRLTTERDEARRERDAFSYDRIGALRVELTRLRAAWNADDTNGSSARFIDAICQMLDGNK